MKKKISVAIAPGEVRLIAEIAHESGNRGEKLLVLRPDPRRELAREVSPDPRHRCRQRLGAEMPCEFRDQVARKQRVLAREKRRPRRAQAKALRRAAPGGKPVGALDQPVALEAADVLVRGVARDAELGRKRGGRERLGRVEEERENAFARAGTGMVESLIHRAPT
jgi:hypothetical protein